METESNPAAEPEISATEAPTEQPTVSEAKPRKLVGYAIVWGALSRIRGDGTYHVFDRDAEITYEADVIAICSHDYTFPVARQSNGSLILTPDDIGLRCEIYLNDSGRAAQTYEDVKSKLIRGMSFGGPGQRAKFQQTSNPSIKFAKSFHLEEVTLTCIPAMEDTTLVIADEAEQMQKNMQKQKEARQIKSKLEGYKVLNYKLGMVSGR